MSTSDKLELTREEQAIEYYKTLSYEELSLELKEFDDSIKESEDQQKLFDALINLEKDDNWKMFKDAYFDSEKDRISNALTGTSSFRDETEKQLHDKLTSIRHLKLFLITTEASAKNSGDAVRDLTVFRELILNELESKKTEV